MIKGFLSLFLLLSPFLLLSQPEGVIKTIPCPDYPYGLTFDGSYLWVGTSYAGGTFIWKVDTADGSIIGSIPIPDPYQFYKVKGLAYDGQNLWVFEDISGTDKFFKVDPNTGAVLKTFNSPENNYIGGMTYVNGHIWYSQYYASSTAGRDVIIKMDTTGATLDTIISVGEQPMGVAFDEQYLWCVEDTGFGTSRQEIYKYDPLTSSYTGEFIRCPDDSPRDMAFDGQNLWLVGYHNTNSVLYKISTAGGTPQISVPLNTIGFSQTTVGDTSDYILSISNSGDAALSIDSIVFDNSVFFVEETIFPYAILPGGNYNFTLHFSPTLYNYFTGIVEIYSNDPVDPIVSLPVMGQGVLSGPVIDLTSNTHNFGDVWTSGEGMAYWNLGIINEGDQNLEISNLLFSDSVFTTDESILPFNVLPNDTQEITVYFNPPNASTFKDTLSITTNDPATPVSKVHLEGNGVSGPFNLGFLFWSYQVPDNPVTSYNEYRPLALKSIKDVTGDGYDDVILATRNYWTICLSGFSSGYAKEVWRFSSYFTNYSAGGIGNTNDLPPQQKALAISEDLNNDGFQDVVIGTGGGNEHVYALDGTNGNIIWQFGTNHPDSFGLGDMTSVYVNEDLNGDNVNDVIATGSGSNYGLEGRRTVYGFDGTNGNFLFQQFLGCFIRMAQTIGDINNNGSIDIVAGTGDGINNSYSIVVFDPQTHLQIWSFPIGSSSGGGKEVVRYEIDNETPDIIAGSYFGKVYRIDGETGSQIWMFNIGSAGIYHVSIIKDVDSDGLDDILVSCHGTTFYCVSGANGQILWNVPFGNSTWSAQAIPDITGDSINDVVAASKTDNIYVLDGTDGTILLSYAMNSGMLQGATLANILPDMDNNGSYEILGASDDGKIVALSGGINVSHIRGESDAKNIPNHYELFQNFPNPFNPETTIKFRLPESELITLNVYNMLGQKITTIIDNKYLNAGEYNVLFDASSFTSGIYIYRLYSKSGILNRKMLYIK